MMKDGMPSILEDVLNLCSVFNGSKQIFNVFLSDVQIMDISGNNLLGMGVPGLTTFIKTHEKKYLRNYKLHNCTVLLDGNSIASNLYIYSHVESAFGGDYDKFSKHVKEFFKILKTCDIRPLVVFDGGYEQRKLGTVYSRMKDKFKSVRSVQPFSGQINFPLFFRIVFREVLSELNIPFAQSDFEADDELAALARQLKCPVISYDSDFYIYDVLYIPFPTVCLEPIPFTRTGVSERDKTSYYLDCKIYNVDVFVESFGGLNKNMLPLLAVLLGNDYIKRSVFKAFYENLKIPKGKSNHLQRRVKAVIEWLRNETFDSAVTKILGRMKKNSRRQVMCQMKKIINGYIQCTSPLTEFLIPSGNEDLGKEKTTDTHLNIPTIITNLEEKLLTADEKTDSQVFGIDLPDIAFEDNASEKSSDESSTDDDSLSNDDFISQKGALEIKKHRGNHNDEVYIEGSNSIPNGLLEYARKGKIQSCVIDILTLKQCFLPPQVEDCGLPASHFISLPILNAVVGLLLGECDTLVKYWTRTGIHLDWYTVEPIHETASLKFPPYDEIFDISESKRRMVLLEVVGVNIEVNFLPDEWQLFIIATVFWLKNMQRPVVTESYMHTVVMCLVAMYTIDSKIGMFRNKQAFTKKYKKYLNKLTESENQDKLLKNANQLEAKQHNVRSEMCVPKEELANISHDDCVLVFETILPYHHLSEQIKAKPKLFNLSTLHAFSQLQSCIFHLMILNSILGFPFKEPVISHLYSGTFIYNVFTYLSSKKNIDANVETLFQNAPSLLSLYKSLISFIAKYISHDMLRKNNSKSNRKKRRKGKSPSDVYSSEVHVDDGDSELFIDENNRFSNLSLDV